jgi:hypothetical protein
MTYHGKVDKVHFLIKWNRQNDEYTIMWDDLTHKGSGYFTHTLGQSVQTIMADRAGLSQYERYQKNYPTSKTSTPTMMYVGNAQIYVVRYIDNTRWWYEAIQDMNDRADWISKLFKPDIQPSKEHLLKQMIKGNFVFIAAQEDKS